MTQSRYKAIYLYRKVNIVEVVYVVQFPGSYVHIQSCTLHGRAEKAGGRYVTPLSLRHPLTLLFLFVRNSFV